MPEQRKVIYALATFVFLFGGWFLITLRMGGRKISRNYGLMYKYVAVPSSNVVFLGDSRTWQGIVPQEWGGGLNFAFEGVALTPEYLGSGLRKLTKNPGDRYLFLGITPLSLLSESAADNGYLRLVKEAPYELSLCCQFAPLLNVYEPLTGEDFLYWHHHENTNQYLPRYYVDGWAEVVAPRETQPKVLEGNLEIYRHHFQARVQSQMLAALLEWVRVHSAETYIVGFRPPACPQLLVLEDELSGLDYNQFISAWKEVGGHWLTVPYDGYTTWDGAHMTSLEARRYTRTLKRSFECAL